MRADLKSLPVAERVQADELAGLRLFANADQAIVAGLVQHCAVLSLRKNQSLLVPGAANQTLYLVLQGRLRVHLESLETTPVWLIEAGETAGDVSLIDAKPVSAYVVADVPTRVLTLDQATFWSLVNTSHAIARNALLMVVERMRANNALVAEGLRLREQYQRHTHVDAVTGLRNRRALEELLRRQLLRSSMGNKPLTLLAVEIDRLAHLQAEFGRSASEQALCVVAQTLQEQLRPTDIVAHLGDGKFGVVLPECNAEGARVVAARLRTAVAETVVVLADASILPSVSISCGIGEMQPFAKVEELLEFATEALARSTNN